MKKMYLILLLLTVASNVTFNNFDPCPSFTMESEKELKKLLKDNGFFYYNESNILARQLANRTMNPFEVVDEVILAADDQHGKFIETLDDAEKSRYNRHKANLITALLTNHPEAIECLKINGNLRDIDPCRSFTMESEEELKELLKNNGFAYFDKKTNISKHFANEEESPYSVYNGMIRIVEDYSEEKLAKLLRGNSLGQLLQTLLTNHPEAIECLILDGVLVKVKD